jgi:hypothetical protein
MPYLEIHVKGNLDPNLSDWFQGMKINPEGDGHSCLCSEVVDNSSIYGILSTLSTLGITLISVTVTDEEGKRGIPGSGYAGVCNG